MNEEELDPIEIQSVVIDGRAWLQAHDVTAFLRRRAEQVRALGEDEGGVQGIAYQVTVNTLDTVADDLDVGTIERLVASPDDTAREL